MAREGKRDQRKEQFWRCLLREWRRSELTIRDFCVEQHVSEPSFYAWRRLIAERDQGTARSFPTAAASIFGRRSFLTRLFPNNRWSRRYLSGREHPDTAPFEVDWVSGAAMMVRRDAIDRVGELDEKFFMHWEDADWCHRMKDAGYGVFCVPASRIVHHEGGSRRGWPPRQLRAFHEGAFRYYAKHHAPWWSPLRYVAAAGLAARAAALIARHHLTNARSGRPAPSAEAR